jgi:hypothetical protein
LLSAIDCCIVVDDYRVSVEALVMPTETMGVYGTSRLEATKAYLPNLKITGSNNSNKRGLGKYF